MTIAVTLRLSRELTEREMWKIEDWTEEVTYYVPDDALVTAIIDEETK